MAMADPWYSSGTFWAAAGAIAVTVFGVVGIVAAYRQANPIQRLGYEMSHAPLLQGSAQTWSKNLKITWNGQPVEEPHIIEITIISHGRQDISAQAFEDQPLEFRLEGAKILTILRTVNSPESTGAPAARAEDDILKIGPSHLSRRQSTKFTLLAEGDRPELRTPSATLHNIDLVNLSAEPAHRPHFGIRWAIGVTAAGVAAALVLLGILIARPSASASQPNTPPTTATTKPSVPGATETPVPVATKPAAIPADVMAELNSPSQSSELSAIATLQQFMKSSPSGQSAAITALADFMRGKSPAGNNDQNVTSVIQAAVNVLRTRNPARDGGAVMDLDNTNLTSANLAGVDLSGASLVNTDFTSANLAGANLSDTDLTDAYLGGATIAGVNLSDATLTDASFYQTPLCDGSKPVQPAEGYNCQA